MTNKEATNFLSQVKSILLNNNSWLESTKTPIKESFDMAISALEKQIPKEPAVMIDTWICPSCNNGIEYQFLLGDNVLFHGFHDFCPKCGQAIDWENE